MHFVDEFGRRVNTDAEEVEEQQQARDFITADCIVLELGARYGTVSCLINKQIGNPLNQVSVEPDQAVWDCLRRNRDANGCTFHILQGAVSRVPLHVTQSGYGTTTNPYAAPNTYTYTLEQVEAMYQLRFNTLVADCEGSLGRFFAENPALLDRLNLILLEADVPEWTDYEALYAKFRSHGLTQIVGGFRQVWRRL
jgi:FkbM family methyltransferase